MCLLLRSQHVRRAVQVQAVFPQRFPVIGEIHQCRVERRLPRLQGINSFTHHAVGIQNGIVVGIHQRLIRAVLDLIGVAGRSKVTVLGRVTLIVGRAVAAHQVDHQHRILFHTIQHVIQAPEIHVINTRVVLTELLKLPLGHVGVRNAVAGAFTSTVVIPPEQINASVAQHIHQSFLMVRKIGIVFFPGHPGEHTWDGDGGFGSAGGGLGEVNHILFFKLGVGLAIVAVQGVIFRPGGFPDNQHQYGLFLLRQQYRTFSGIFTETDQGLIAGEPARLAVFGDSADVVSRSHHFDDAFVIAKQRGIVLIKDRRYQNNHHCAGENCREAY